MSLSAVYPLWFFGQPGPRAWSVNRLTGIVQNLEEGELAFSSSSCSGTPFLYGPLSAWDCSAPFYVASSTPPGPGTALFHCTGVAAQIVVSSYWSSHNYSEIKTYCGPPAVVSTSTEEVVGIEPLPYVVPQFTPPLTVR